MSTIFGALPIIFDQSPLLGSLTTASAKLVSKSLTTSSSSTPSSGTTHKTTYSVAPQAPLSTTTIYGSAENNSLQGSAGNDTIEGRRGDDSLLGMDGNDFLIGGLGNDSLRGSSGRDQLYGESGKDRLLGGTGNDILSGGSGNDILVGGTGRDYFVIETGGGRDIIRDFEDGRDIIALSDDMKLSDLTLTQVGSDTLISAGSQRLGVLQDIRVNQITSSDFMALSYMRTNIAV